LSEDESDEVSVGAVRPELAGGEDEVGGAE
jgi:hypothetical protein